MTVDASTAVAAGRTDRKMTPYTIGEPISTLINAGVGTSTSRTTCGSR